MKNNFYKKVEDFVKKTEEAVDKTIDIVDDVLTKRNQRKRSEEYKKQQEQRKKQMSIICSHCNEKHKADYSEYIKCKKCANDFGGFTFQAKKTIKKTIGTTALIGAVAAGTHYTDDYLYYRYPTSFEYNIISQCAYSRYGSNSYEIDRRIKRCTCALERTMKTVHYQQIQVSPETFTSLFKNNLEQICK